MKKTLISLFTLGIFCLLPFHEGEADNSKDQLNLSLTKTLHIKKYKNYKVYYDVYTVKEGEWLWKILKKNYNIPSEKRVDFLHILKRINPTISNADEVYPGQEVFVPIRLEVDARESATIYPTEEVTATSGMRAPEGAEEYTVRPGQSLSGILIYVFKVPKDLVYSQYIDRFRELNPEIEDPNIIQAHQKILVPVKVPVPEDKDLPDEVDEVPPTSVPEIDEEPEAPSLAKDVSPEESPSPLRPLAPSPDEDKSDVSTEGATAPYVRETDPQIIRDSLGAFFSGVEDRYIDRGEFFIPIPGGADLTLDTKTFPILEMSNGRKIIVDFGDKLPEKVEGLIKSNWKNYRTVNIQKDDSTESIFTKLFSLAGYHSVLRGDKPFLLEGGIKTSIWGDWIVLKEKESLNKGTVYVLNLIDKENKGVPSEIKGYLQRNGVQVIDLSVTGEKESRQTGEIDEKEIVILNSSTNKGLIRDFLKMVGQPFTEGEKVPLTKTSSGGFQMGVTADIFLQREESDCIISLQNISGDLMDILTENGFKVLRIGRGETQESIISKLLGLLDLEFSSSTFEFDTIQKGHPHNISLSVPGLLFQRADSSKFLLTRVNLDRDLVRFLRGQGVEAVQY